MAKKSKWTLRNIVKEMISTAVILLVVSNVVSYFRAPVLDSSRFPLLSGSFIDATPVKMQAYQDKPVLVYVWATWCPVCKMQSPNIARLAKDYTVLSIAVQSGESDEIKRYMQEQGVDFRVLNDVYGEIAKKFKVSVYPSVFIYNAQGELAFSEVGYTSTLGLMIRMWWAK